MAIEERSENPFILKRFQRQFWKLSFLHTGGIPEMPFCEGVGGVSAGGSSTHLCFFKRRE